MTALLHHVSLHTDGTCVFLKQIKLYSNLNDIETLSSTNLWMASCVIVLAQCHWFVGDN